MGLAFVTGAIGVPITGAIADHIGLQAALGLQVAVVAATVAAAALLPTEEFLKRLADPVSRARTPTLAATD
jgi:MFS family permease